VCDTRRQSCLARFSDRHPRTPHPTYAPTLRANLDPWGGIRYRVYLRGAAHVLLACLLEGVQQLSERPVTRQAVPWRC
jgi:hypothetical protein